MSGRPRLLRKQSSLAIVVGQAKPNPREEESEAEVSEEEPPIQVDQQSDGGDTDVVESSDDEVQQPSPPLANGKPTKARSKSQLLVGEADDVEPPYRMSRRLMSMKRRGKVRPLAELTEEFEFYAGDILTVRGEDDDFYVCRVLEDVSETATNFGVAWYNRVSENVYEVIHLHNWNLVLTILKYYLIKTIHPPPPPPRINKNPD